MQARLAPEEFGNGIACRYQHARSDQRKSDARKVKFPIQIERQNELLRLFSSRQEFELESFKLNTIYLIFLDKQTQL